jgi:hypothetical protein
MLDLKISVTITNNTIKNSQNLVCQILNFVLNNYCVVLSTNKKFQILCFLTLEVHSKKHKIYRKCNGNQTDL